MGDIVEVATLSHIGREELIVDFDGARVADADAEVLQEQTHVL